MAIMVSEAAVIKLRKGIKPENMSNKVIRAYVYSKG
jgi:hypothetical protein